MTVAIYEKTLTKRAELLSKICPLKLVIPVSNYGPKTLSAYFDFRFNTDLIKQMKIAIAYINKVFMFCLY